MKIRNQFYLPAIISLVFVIGMLFGYAIKSFPVQENIEWKKDIESEKALSEVIRLIEERYYEDKESSILVDKAIYEMMDELDPYSMYVPSYHSEMFEVSNSGKYEGIGIETIDIDDEIYISKVIKGSPADSASLLKGSKVVGINSINLKKKNWNADSLSFYLSDFKNEALKLELKHFSYLSNQTLEIRPSEVKIPNISDSYILEDGVGYIRISKFGNDSYKEFMGSLEGLMTNDSLANLIIDVRDNPGGYLQEVCKIISQLLPERSEFLSTVDANGNDVPYKSTGQSFFEIGNVVVLIDEESASASEILAGVLQDMDRAIVVGEDSFGKGLVQEQFQLSNGGVARLSVSRYKLPSGRYIGDVDTLNFNSLKLKRNLQSKGAISPDFEVEHSFVKNDLDLFRQAIRNMNTTILPEELEDYLNSTDYGVDIKYETADIRYGGGEVYRMKLMEDDVIQKSLEVLKTKDTWGILK